MCILFKYTGLNRITDCVENGVFASEVDKVVDIVAKHAIEYVEQNQI